MRPWRLATPGLPGVVVVIALSICAGGCSFSYQLDSMFGKGDDDTTGSIKPAIVTRLNTQPSESDLVATRAAVSEVLARGGNDSSIPWENPKTGARGTVTPIAAARAGEDGLTCRDFLASYVSNGSESWLQGEACRLRQGKWEVRTIKPWRRT